MLKIQGRSRREGEGGEQQAKERRSKAQRQDRGEGGAGLSQGPEDRQTQKEVARGQACAARSGEGLRKGQS